jgi:hypothetical protein
MANASDTTLERTPRAPALTSASLASEFAKSHADPATQKAMADFAQFAHERVGNVPWAPDTMPVDRGGNPAFDAGPDNEPRDEKGEWASSGGIVAFHGTAHEVPQFSAGVIGTGEGNQALGYGLYFAGNQEVAKHHQRVLGGASGGNPARAGRRRGSHARPFRRRARLSSSRPVIRPLVGRSTSEPPPPS